MTRGDQLIKEGLEKAMKENMNPDGVLLFKLFEYLDEISAEIDKLQAKP